MNEAILMFHALAYVMNEAFVTLKKGIQLTNRKSVNALLYADDKILITTLEDELQTMAYHLNLIARKYKMIISSSKTKSMAMWGNHIQSIKIVINNNIIEQVTDLNTWGTVYQNKKVI